jgi:hypothetical protein
MHFGAVIVAAIAIKLLTFVNSQDLGNLFGILSRLRGGGQAMVTSDPSAIINAVICAVIVILTLHFRTAFVS